MTTALEKTLKRELGIDGRIFVVALSPESLKLTLKGKRKGLELKWQDLVSGEAALAVALNASVGKFSAKPVPVVATPSRPQEPARPRAPKRRA
jgi:hypothetical protein